METSFNNWSNLVASVRNDLVFEQKNKAYGAYYLRRNHNRSLAFALFISASFFLSLALIPLIMSMYKPLEVTGLDETTQIMPEVTTSRIFEIPKAPELPQKQIVKKTISTAPLLVIDDNIKDPILPKDDNAKNGKETSDIGDPTTGDIGGDINANGNSTVIIETKKDDKPLLFVEKMPEFVGGVEAMMKYIQDEMEYPDIPTEVSGTCYLSFVVEKDGSITNVTLSRGVSDAPEYGKAALKVIKSMPKWKPGKQNGVPVRVQMVIPIKFKQI